jgi:hypothetical protein
LDGVGAVGEKNHVDGAEAQWLAAFEARFGDFGAIDVGSIGGAHVLDNGGAVIDADLAVGARNTGVLKSEVIAGTAAQKVEALLELDFPSLRRPGVDYESRHVE